jgi:16S rRNA (adenine1518-N6/adenine1519-N6)-dimethyltransferase
LAACPQVEPLVIEIGPGRGALTRHLAPRCERLIAIERDPELANLVRAALPSAELIESDVLQVDFSQWPDAVIAGNLPYYITSPILDKVLHSTFKRAVFLVQKEVALRLIAKPDSRDYGYLSVRTQLLADVKVLFKVAPGSFSPPPKVDSAVICLTPVKPSVDPEAFLRFASACFAHKRKTLRNNLAGLYQNAAFPEESMRAEQLSIPALVSLYTRLAVKR